MPMRARLIRIGLNVALDAAFAAASVPTARWLAGVDPPSGVASAMAASAACLLLSGVPFRLTTQYWRFAALRDLAGVAGAAVLGTALFAALPGTIAGWPHGIVQTLVLLVLLAAPRAAYRLMASPNGRAKTEQCWAIGDAEDAALFASALDLHRRPDPMLPHLSVVAVLSLADRQVGRRLRGVPILGTVSGAEMLLDRAASDGTLPRALVLVSDIPGGALAALLAVAERHGVIVRRAARPAALTPGAAVPPVLRPVAIEELLNRPQVALDRDGMARLIQGARVVVTGAGGSIGSELARQVAALGPEALILLDNGEFALWQIDLELSERFPAVPRTRYLADVRDPSRIGALFARERPALVFHAAALKHVPMLEDNPAEGLLTNAYGTRVVADAARAAGARAMVLISTDKAVNPSSVMGASKRLAEMYAQALDAQAGVGGAAPGAAGGGMRCVTVRFGNVLGSTGSVVPLFSRQLAAGGPLTVTHPDMKRYFMTVREAVGLVLQASLAGIGMRPDEGGIFVLDMGEPVRIVDLARQMIRLAGLRPDADVPIRFTGLRPGEKLFEELFHGQEAPAKTAYPGLLMARPRVADAQIAGRAIDEIAHQCRAGNSAQALATLARLIPEFTPWRPDAAGDASA